MAYVAVPLVIAERPAPSSNGASDARATLIAAMADLLVRERPPTIADALRLLRLVYPDHPLALRLAALAVAARTISPP